MNRFLMAAALAVFLSAPAFAATCKISEYQFVVRDQRNVVVLVAMEPPLATQNITYTTTTQSAKFNERTAFIRIVCDAKAHFVVGTDPSADANDPYLTADTPEYFGLPPNNAEDYEVAFYDGSS